MSVLCGPPLSHPCGSKLTPNPGGRYSLTYRPCPPDAGPPVPVVQEHTLGTWSPLWAQVLQCAQWAFLPPCALECADFGSGKEADCSLQRAGLQAEGERELGKEEGKRLAFLKSRKFIS